jgi:hypothetical protein
MVTSLYVFRPELYTLITSPIRATCSTHLILLDLTWEKLLNNVHYCVSCRAGLRGGVSFPRSITYEMNYVHVSYSDINRRHIDLMNGNPHTNFGLVGFFFFVFVFLFLLNFGLL